MAILILDKINFKSKTVWRVKEGHYVFTKEQIHQRDITLTTYMPSNKQSPKYMEQTLNELKEGTDSSMITVGNFTMGRPYRHKISKDIENLNNTVKLLT